MVYTPTNWSQVTDTYSLLSIANTNADNWFYTGILIMIFGVVLITLAGAFGFEAGLLSAGFFTLVLSLFLVYMGLAPMWIAGACVGLLLATIAYIIWSGRAN